MFMRVRNNKEQDNVVRRARYKKRLDAGLCPVDGCPNKSTEDGVVCQVCRWNRLERDLLKFGLTLEDYAWMEYRQNRVCFICKRSCVTGRSLAVDHNWKTGLVRALLCQPCNTLIGKAREDEVILLAAVEYLRSTP